MWEFRTFMLLIIRSGQVYMGPGPQLGYAPGPTYAPGPVYVQPMPQPGPVYYVQSNVNKYV